MIRKAVLPTAGLGTRLLPITKELPKEMLPIFVKGSDGQRCVKPILQAIFEQLHGLGFRDFCFVVGREKRAIEDHFTPDFGFLKMLEARRSMNASRNLKAFYESVSSSTFFWVNQPRPIGFGDSVLRAETFVGNNPFLCHAGDEYVRSQGDGHLKRMIDIFQTSHVDAIFLAQRVKNPRSYGVIEGVKVGERLYEVRMVAEKPEKPKSDLTIIPLYVFSPLIFKTLRKVRPGAGGEYQLTDAIQGLIDRGSKVRALELGSSDLRLDMGTPETYWEALRVSHGRL